MTPSASKKKIEATSAITRTNVVDTIVSLRVGHATFFISWRTSRMNLAGFSSLIFSFVNWIPAFAGTACAEFPSIKTHTV